METDLQLLLKDFGLTNVEIQLFTELSRLGVSSIGKLIKSTQLHRGTAYNTLQRLKDKGVVALTKKENCYYYFPNPSGFLSILEKIRIDLENKEEFVKKLTTHMRLRRSSNTDEQPDMYLIEGEHAFKGAFVDILNYAQQNEEPYLALSNGGAMYDRLGCDYYKRAQQMKLLKHAKCKIILNTRQRMHPFAKDVVGTLRWLEGINFSSIHFFINGDKVLLVDWQSRPLHTTIIRNCHIVQYHTSLWKHLWQKEARTFQEHYGC